MDINHNRNWLTTREVRAVLGNLTQQRVSQLVREGLLVVDPDPSGQLRYDRATVERLAAERAARRERDHSASAERAALHAEARDRLARERRRRDAEQRERRERRDELFQRAVVALEAIAKKPCR